MSTEVATLELKKTINLPKTKFAQKANLPQSEPARLKKWATPRGRQWGLTGGAMGTWQPISGILIGMANSTYLLLALTINLPAFIGMRVTISQTLRAKLV